jgi:hypothetical protein
MRRILLARFGIDLFEAARAGGDELEPDVFARCLQLCQALRLAFLFAPLSDGDVEQTHAGFTHNAKRDPANNAFIVGMWRKEESFGGIRRESGCWNGSKASQRH